MCAAWVLVLLPGAAAVRPWVLVAPLCALRSCRVSLLCALGSLGAGAAAGCLRLAVWVLQGAAAVCVGVWVVVASLGAGAAAAPLPWRCLKSMFAVWGLCWRNSCVCRLFLHTTLKAAEIVEIY